MKSTLTTLILLLSFYSFSQNKNGYKINQVINIDKIELKKKSFKKLSKKTLTSISLHRENDSISYLCKTYNYGPENKPEVLKDWRFCQNSINIKTSLFDNIVKELNSLNIKNINSSKEVNVIHGTRYDLNFSGNSYSINTHTKTPTIKTEERGLTQYLSICDEIWKLAEIK